MRARTFISLMLVLMVFTAGLFVFASPAKQEAQKTECPAGKACTVNKEASSAEPQAADGMIWQTVSRHLLSAVQ